MLVNSKQKKIVAYQWERNMVCGFITYVLKGNSDDWSVEFLDGDTKQEDYLFKKSE